MTKEKGKLNDMLWCEKFRPKTFEDVINLDFRIPKLLNRNMPHLLFIGPPGTGKTTISKIIINELKCDFLMLNASDERGIDTIRNKVKMFAMTRSSRENVFKVVVLDEMDYLTNDAMAILRSIFDTYARNCRFILTANFENKIIEPIKSRCSKFTFKKVSDEELLKLLIKICDSENVSYTEDILRKIINVSKGDIRKSINLLQQNVKDKKLMSDVTYESDIKDVLEKLKQGKFDDVRKELIERGTDWEQLLSEFFEYVSNDKVLSLEQRKRIILELAECLYQMSFVLIKEIPFARFLIKVEEILK